MNRWKTAENILKNSLVLACNADDTNHFEMIRLNQGNCVNLNIK
jgi:hypothetical protein